MQYDKRWEGIWSEGTGGETPCNNTMLGSWSESGSLCPSITCTFLFWFNNPSIWSFHLYWVFMNSLLDDKIWRGPWKMNLLVSPWATLWNASLCNLSAEGLRLPNCYITSDIIDTFIMKNSIIVSASYMTVRGSEISLLCHAGFTSQRRRRKIFWVWEVAHRVASHLTVVVPFATWKYFKNSLIFLK